MHTISFHPCRTTTGRWVESMRITVAPSRSPTGNGSTAKRISAACVGALDCATALRAWNANASTAARVKCRTYWWPKEPDCLVVIVGGIAEWRHARGDVRSPNDKIAAPHGGRIGSGE